MATKTSCTKICSKAGNFFFSYDTLKIVKINNKKVGLLNRTIQMAILGYVVGYAIIWKKGYQEVDTSPVSSVVTKLKGTSIVNFTSFNSSILRGMHIFDPADYVVPPQENNAFFVMTNMILTPNQTRSKCPEDPKFKDNHCKTDADCIAMTAVTNGNGIRTGNCVKSDQKSGLKVCEIYAWCPVENDVLPMPGHGFKPGEPLLNEAENFTVLLKNSISFLKFSFTKRNIRNENNSRYLKSCTFDHFKDKLCPIFRLGDIVRETGNDFQSLSYMGGNIGIIITWNCNLDLDESQCLPEYSFRRIDDPDAPIAQGYNFRFPQYYVENGAQYRLLYKAYGIKFDILVKGKAGKFSIVPLLLNLGSGLALLGIATVWCDLVVLYCLKKKDMYKSHKYHQVGDSDVQGVKACDSDVEEEGVSPGDNGQHKEKSYKYKPLSDEER